jgi:hypothetical protein
LCMCACSLSLCPSLSLSNSNYLDIAHYLVFFPFFFWVPTFSSQSYFWSK